MVKGKKERDEGGGRPSSEEQESIRESQRLRELAVSRGLLSRSKANPVASLLPTKSRASLCLLISSSVFRSISVRRLCLHHTEGSCKAAQLRRSCEVGKWGVIPAVVCDWAFEFLSAAIRKCDGKDIVKKGNRKTKYLFAFPGLVAPIAGGVLGELTHLDSRNPVFYINFPQVSYLTTLILLSVRHSNLISFPNKVWMSSRKSWPSWALKLFFHTYGLYVSITWKWGSINPLVNCRAAWNCLGRSSILKINT